MAKIQFTLEINLTTRGSFAPVVADETLFRPPTAKEFAGIIALDLRRRLCEGNPFIKAADVRIVD